MGIAVTPAGSFSFLPVEARAPLSETLGWQTDITPAYDGGENRVCLLQRARQTFEMAYPVRHILAPEVFNTVYGSQVAPWLAPAWGEAQYVGPLAIGAVGAPVGNAFADLRAGGLALLWDSGCSGYAIVQLTTVGADSITFDAIGVALAAAFVVPLRQAWLGPTQKKTGGHDAVWSATFEVDDTIDLAPGAPAQYLGEDIYFDDNIMDGDTFAEKVSTQLDRADYDVGRVTISTPWDHARVSRPFGVFTDTLAEAWAFRMWLHRRQGRYRAFWQPTFENDMRLAQSGAVAGTLTVKADAWPDLATHRVHIAVETASGWSPRQITGAVVVGDDVELTLSSSLATNAALIRRISYLGLRRLDTDKVELQWMGSGCMQSMFRTVELVP